MVKDPQKMTTVEKHYYIFENQPPDYYVRNRFEWFESLLSDIRTLIQGGQQLKNTPSPELGGNFGAGVNFQNIPISTHKVQMRWIYVGIIKFLISASEIIRYE